MQLSAWLTRQAVTRTEFSRRVRVSVPHITGICAGASLPSCELLARIEQETNGEVTARDFVSVAAPPSARGNTNIVNNNHLKV